MNGPDYLESVFYVVVRAKRNSWTRWPWGLYAPRVTRQNPTLKKDEVAVKIRLKIPTQAFQEHRPEIVIDVPDELVKTPFIADIEEP